MVVASSVLFAAPPPVHATRPPSFIPLDIRAANGKVWFLQRDGRGTTIELATGAVTRGGERHDDWPRPPRCDIVEPPCRLSTGELTLMRHEEGETLFDMKAGRGQWQAVLSVATHARPPGWAWEVDGMLLMETPGWGISTLECLDIASGRARWLYAYPTPWPTMAWTPMGDRDQVAGLREKFAYLETLVRDRQMGSYPAGGARSDGYAGAVVLDPDPMFAGRVRVGLLLGWAAVAVALALAAMRVLRRPGRHFTALTVGLALVIVAVGLIEPILVTVLWLVFLAVFAVATADMAAPRAFLRVVLLVTAAIVWFPSFMASIQR